MIFNFPEKENSKLKPKRKTKMEKQTIKLSEGCSRCGLCCHKVVDGFLTRDKCEFLKRITKGRTVCMVYSSRLKRKLKIGGSCNKREKVRYDYPKCPLNNDRIMVKIKEADERYFKKWL